MSAPRTIFAEHPVREVELRQRVKQAGGKWNCDRKVWELRYADVVALPLEARIVDERVSDTRCRR